MQIHPPTTVQSAPRQGPHPGYGTGTIVWLFRHAEVHEDWHGVAYGSLDVPLSRMGIEDTERIGRDFAVLRLRAVLSSPLSRARALGEVLARRTGAPLAIEVHLREIDRGAWQGRRISELNHERPSEVEALFTDPWSWRGHGGETDADVLARGWPVLERAVQGGGTVAIASHYNTIRVLVAHAIGIPPALSFRLRVDPGCATQLWDAGGSDGGWKLVRSNARTPGALELAGAEEGERPA